MARQNHTQFHIGQRVAVSNGQPKPPERFNRKLANWKHDNYIGFIKEIEAERSYSPYGRLILKRDDYPDGKHGSIEFTFNIPLGGHLIVEPLEVKEAA